MKIKTLVDWFSYRLLRGGEKIRAGDFFQVGVSEWYPVHISIGATFFSGAGCIVRRPRRWRRIDLRSALSKIRQWILSLFWRPMKIGEKAQVGDQFFFNDVRWVSCHMTQGNIVRDGGTLYRRPRGVYGIYRRWRFA